MSFSSSSSSSSTSSQHTTSATITPALDLEEKIYVRERTASLNAEYEAYLKEHPELTDLLNDYMADVLLKKPGNIYDHAHEYFSRLRAETNVKSAGSGPRPLVVCGPSGVGKGTLIGKLMKEYPDKFGFSVSHTTRAPRPGEENGVHYNFTTKEAMTKMADAGGFIETAHVHGNMYGSSYAAVQKVCDEGKVCVLDIDVQGAKSVKKSRLNAVSVFILPPSMVELEKRLRGRGTETEEKIQLRIGNAAAEIEFSKTPGFFDYVITNDDFDTCYETFKQVALSLAL